jgi:hypothetical protein
METAMATSSTGTRARSSPTTRGEMRRVNIRYCTIVYIPDVLIFRARTYGHLRPETEQAGDLRVSLRRDRETLSSTSPSTEITVKLSSTPTLTLSARSSFSIEAYMNGVYSYPLAIGISLVSLAGGERELSIGELATKEARAGRRWRRSAPTVKLGSLGPPVLTSSSLGPPIQTGPWLPPSWAFHFHCTAMPSPISINTWGPAG